MGRVGFDGFVILWPKPNPPRYKFFFFLVTQPNPTHQALKTDSTRRVGLGWVRFSGSVGFLHTLLPITVFTCKTIVNLELRFDIVLDPPSNFQFPSLKILCLYRNVYKYDNSFSNLISGCPVLEDLTVALREGLDGATNYNINVPTLKRLDIDVEWDYKFEIYAPALHYFRFFGDLGNLAFLEKLTNFSWSACLYLRSALGSWKWITLWRSGIQACSRTKLL